MTSPRPINITLNKPARQLLIDWSDGRHCAYPITPLRLACPCADCRGGHENMGRHSDPKDLLDLSSDRDYEIVRIEQVGNYALQFVWDDGHNSGIYTWDFLYRLCPSS